MAYAYKTFKMALGTSYATAYTCPAATTAVVLRCTVYNIHGTNSATMDAQFLDSSDANAAGALAPAALPVAAQQGYSLVAKEGPLGLEAGDALQLKASAASVLYMTGLVREET